MGSHWHLFANWKPVSESRRRQLAKRLLDNDRDCDVIVYTDGMRGTWRNPLGAGFKHEWLLGLLAHFELTSELFFEPLKCDQLYPDCTCSKMGDDYGCAFAASPWNDDPKWLPPKGEK